MATYYWVGGTGTWSATGNTQFAITSGGVPTLLDPTSADIVIFNSSSGGGTCTLGTNVSCLTLNLNTYTGTLAFGTNTITLAGNAATIFTGGAGYSVTGTPLIICNYSGGTGTRTITPGTTVTEPNTISFNITAGTDIVDNQIAGIFKALNFTGFSGSLANRARTLYGNLTISSGMTVTAGTSATTFAATSGTQQITTNGKTLDFPITQSGVGGTVQLQDNLTMGSTRTYTLTAGTLDLNNQTLSAGAFLSTNSNTRSIAFGTGNITVTGTALNVWNFSIAGGFTYTGTPTVNATYAGATSSRGIYHGATSGATETNSPSFNISAGTDSVIMQGSFLNVNFTGFAGTLTNIARTIYGDFTVSSGMTLTLGSAATTFAATSGTKNITTALKTLDFPLTFNGIGGTFAFQDALTQGSTRAFTVTNGTVQLKAGATSTVGSFVTSGTTQKYLQSTTPGAQATISDTAGTASVSYLTIQDSNAVGGASWLAYAANNNVDAGNNTNWDFGETPVLGAEYTYKLRSFTQPRRF